MTGRSPKTMDTCTCCGKPTVSTEVGTGRCWECVFPRVYLDSNGQLTGSIAAWVLRSRGYGLCSNRLAEEAA